MLIKEHLDDLKGVWFTSDLHFSHKNILKYCPESRKFNSVEDMDLHLLSLKNLCLKPSLQRIKTD